MRFQIAFHYSIFSSIFSQYQGQKFAYLGHKIVKMLIFQVFKRLLKRSKINIAYNLH